MPRLPLLLLLVSGCPTPPAADAGPSDAGTRDVPSIDAGGLDTPMLDAPALDVPGLDAPGLDAPVPVGTAYGMPMTVGMLPVGPLPETSGIVASRSQPGVFWVHNDSGHPADLFAIDATGAVLATIRLSGATNVDWEDISIGRRGGVEEIYVADVGDNAARTSDGAMGRASIQLYRLPEPDASLGDATVTPERIELRYPMRPYDCESVFVDHETGDVYLVTKESAPAEVFVARAPLSTTGPTMLTRVGAIDLSMTTAADMSNDRARIVVRGYATVRVFVLGPGADVAAALAGSFITAPSGAAAEAIAFEHDGWGLYTVPEGSGASLVYLPWE